MKASVTTSHIRQTLCYLFLLLTYATSGAETERPNILFLLADDQRYDTMGVTGNTVIPTPQLDRLANEGVLFEQSFVVSSACAPNRAAIFSGMYNRSSGVRDFSADFSPEIREQLYPYVLKDAGYYIGFIGKWGVAATIAACIEPYAERFDFWRGFVGQGHYYGAGNNGEHLTQIMAEQADEFFSTAPKDRPFCLSVSFKAPHGPWHEYDQRFEDVFDDTSIPYPPSLSPEAVMKLPDFMRTFRLSLDGHSVADIRNLHENFVRNYYRLILGLDEAVGKIRASLEEHGYADNTIIVYGSDNGHFLHEWGFHGKWLMYEPSIRVPLIIYDPRLPDEQRGQRNEDIVLSIDYAPTFLDLAGLSAPENMQGRSLKPLVYGEKPHDWRDDMFYDYAFEMYPGDIPKSIGVRTDRYKLVRYIGQEPHYEQLFDLEKDPLELNNLIDNPDFFSIRHDLRKRLSDYRMSLPDRAPDHQEYINTYQVLGIGDTFPDSEIDFAQLESIGQSFIAETDELVQAEWRWPFFIQKYPDQGIRASLRRGGPDGELIAERTLPPEHIYNLNLARIPFNAKNLKPGEQLYMEISPIGNPGKRRLGLWRYSKDIYPDGKSYLNSEPQTGDFPFYFVFRK